MARADSGGFDMVLELSVPAINEMVRDLLPTQVDRTWSLDVALWRLVGWGLSARVHVTVGEVQLAAGVAGGPPALTWAVSAEGSQMCWDALEVLGLDVIDAGCAPFAPVVTLSATPTAAGKRLSVEQIRATVTLPPGTLEAVPGVSAYLALFDLIPGGKTREEARVELYQKVQSGLSAALNAVLPNTVPLAVLPVESVALAVVGSELRVLMNIDAVALPPSDPGAITRSALRRPPAGSSGPTDLAALIVGNDWLMRSKVRPALELGLGLDAGGFRAPHPCFWSGTKSLTNHFDMDVVLTQVLGEIDQGGNARVSVVLSGTHSTGAFGLTARATIGLGVSIGADHTLRVAVQEPTVSEVDVWVAAWVYVLAVFFPGDPLVLLALGLVDACAGDGARAALTAALNGRLNIPDVEVSVPSIANLHIDLSMVQADAEWQMATLPMGPVPLTLPLSRANDVIARLYRGP